MTPESSQNDPTIARLARAYQLFELRRYADAIEAAGDVLTIEPDHPGAHRLTALAALQLERFELAESSAATYLAYDPESADAHYLMGHIQNIVKKNKIAAESHFRTMIRCDRDFAEGYGVLGLFLGQQGRVEEGITVARKGLKVDSDSLTILQALQTLYRVNKEPKMADKIGRQALELYPEEAEQHLEVGLRLLEMGGKSAGTNARSSFLESLRIDPDDQEIRHVIAHERVRNHPFFKNGFFLSFKPSIMVPALMVPLVWYALALLLRPFIVLAWLSVVALLAGYLYHGSFLVCRHVVRHRIDRGDL